MRLHKIRLELARSHEFPGGSSKHGYELVAPLDDDGYLDASGWKKQRGRCRMRRFWGNEDEEVGHLVRKPGGAWAFHYDIHGDSDSDESGYRLQSHKFALGEYISIREHDDILRTFRIVRMEALSP
ncbi:MAG TPA: hypothetical protein VE986_06625 [Hyphomicrobiales bacterium]|nr:hypothetical protein [Hyphomicrobiales bacterium]